MRSAQVYTSNYIIKTDDVDGVDIPLGFCLQDASMYSEERRCMKT